jgi:thiol-disulfide isomerase/thioredoxin
MTEATRTHAKKRLAMVLAGGIAGVAVGLGGIYGISTLIGNKAPSAATGANAACQGTVDLAKRIAPLVRGEVAAVSMAKTPLKVPAFAFQDASGARKTIDDFRGKTVLLNLWATWCTPCREEMPTLEALERKKGGADFQVVAVNIDTRDPEKPKAWLKEVGIDGLAYYADPEARAFQELKAVGRAFGMPTTMLIDSNGCEIGTLAGPAHWASDDAIKMIEAAMAGSKRGG